MRPSRVSAVTPSSRPVSWAMRPFSTFSTVVPVNRITLPVAAGSGPAAERKQLRRTSRPQRSARLQGAGPCKPDSQCPLFLAASHTRTEKSCLLSLTTKAARPAPGSRSCQAPRGRQPTRPAARPRPARNLRRQLRSEARRREPAPAQPPRSAAGKPGQPTGSPRTASPAADFDGKPGGPGPGTDQGRSCQAVTRLRRYPITSPRGAGARVKTATGPVPGEAGTSEPTGENHARMIAIPPGVLTRQRPLRNESAGWADPFGCGSLEGSG